MKKLLTIAFIGLSCFFLGKSIAVAYDGNDEVDINWVGIDIATVSYSTAVQYVGAGKYAVYSVVFPTGCFTDYVDVFDSSVSVVPNVTRQKFRIYNDAVSASTKTLVNSDGNAITSSIREFKYPIKLYTGLAWFTTNSSGTVTSLGYNKKSGK